MGCGGSKDDVADQKDGEGGEGGGGDDQMEFGNPLQGGKGNTNKKVTWKPAQEQSEEDMRRSRLVLSTFDGLVHKLKTGKKEHEFVAAMLDLEVYVDLKPHAVPDDAQALLLDARNGLLRNARRGPFWRAKATEEFYKCMMKMPVKMDLGNWVDAKAPKGSAKGVHGRKIGGGGGSDRASSSPGGGGGSKKKAEEEEGEEAAEEEEDGGGDDDGGDDDGGGDEEGDEEDLHAVDDEAAVMDEPPKKSRR